MVIKLLKQYADKFDDNFPLFFVKHLEEKEVADIIRKAIDTGKPYEADYDEKGDY